MSADVVGKISYLNTAPFFEKWPHDEFSLFGGAPRELAAAARADDIVAAPLPIVECWQMEDRFSPLGNWGIVAREKCESVLVLSKRRFCDLDEITIGVTQDSSTSVVLCDVLISQRYKHRVRLRRGLLPTDEARLVIGDEALRLFAATSQTWPCVTDLAAQWWDWQRLPFVFARWVVKRNDLLLESKLWRAISQSLAVGRQSYGAIAQRIAREFNLTEERIVSYLNNFDYEIDRAGQESIGLFRELAVCHEPEMAEMVALT